MLSWSSDHDADQPISGPAGNHHRRKNTTGIILNLYYDAPVPKHSSPLNRSAAFTSCLNFAHYRQLQPQPLTYKSAYIGMKALLSVNTGRTTCRGLDG
jgi:hypothetical protein